MFKSAIDSLIEYFSGSLLPAICLIATGYVSSNVSLAVCLIILGAGCSGISYVGWGVNPLDLAPQYAGQNRYTAGHSIIILFISSFLQHDSCA